MEFFENVININTIVGNDLKKIIEQKKKNSHGLVDTIILLQNILALCHKSLSSTQANISQILGCL